MIRQAFNALTRLHSRVATLKRLGSPDIYSPIRVTPANYFRFLRGPEYTTVRGVEFIIPLDTMLGEFAQNFTFSAVPDDGDFKLKFGSLTTAAINFDATSADIQTAVRLLTGYASALVTGDFSTGFKITFSNVSAAPTLGELADNTLTIATVAITATFSNTHVLWTKPIKKGDVIIDGANRWTTDEIIEMNDLGAIVIGFRIRCD